MSLQAIAGVAFQRLYPDKPTRFSTANIQAHAAAKAAGDDGAKKESVKAAESVNQALESLKRYIPTELLAIYLPVVTTISGHDPTYLWWTYLGFLAATPLVVLALYIVNAAATEAPLSFGKLPIIEPALGLAAFAVWGAAVPGVFAGNQWWLGLLALVSSVLLPLAESVARKLAPSP